MHTVIGNCNFPKASHRDIPERVYIYKNKEECNYARILIFVVRENAKNLGAWYFGGTLYNTHGAVVTSSYFPDARFDPHQSNFFLFFSLC